MSAHDSQNNQWKLVEGLALSWSLNVCGLFSSLQLTWSFVLVSYVDGLEGLMVEFIPIAEGEFCCEDPRQKDALSLEPIKQGQCTSQGFVSELNQKGGCNSPVCVFHCSWPHSPGVLVTYTTAFRIRTQGTRRLFWSRQWSYRFDLWNRL